MAAVIATHDCPDLRSTAFKRVSELVTSTFTSTVDARSHLLFSSAVHHHQFNVEMGNGRSLEKRIVGNTSSK